MSAANVFESYACASAVRRAFHSVPRLPFAATARISVKPMKVIDPRTENDVVATILLFSTNNCLYRALSCTYELRSGLDLTQNYTTGPLIRNRFTELPAADCGEFHLRRVRLGEFYA